MPKIIRYIIILLIILVIAIIILINVLNNTSLYKVDYIEEDEMIVEDEIEKTLRLVENRMDYYTVKEIVNKYYSYYKIIYNMEEYYPMDDQETIKESEKININVLYNLLDEEYIQAKEVTIDNLKTKLTGIKNSTLDITNIYVCEKTEEINVYLVKGMLREIKTKNIINVQLIVKLDIKNKTFSIIPQEYLEEKYNNLEIGKEIENISLDSIKENKNNTFKFKATKEDIYIKDLFNQVKGQMEISIELIYNKLDEEYREKYFGTLSEFEDYINSKNEQYNKMQISEYKAIIKNGYTEYICSDKNFNYYIFKETAPFQYKLILDNYSIPTGNFEEEYKQKTDPEKVVLNIKRFFMGIDDKNYGYSYSVLSETFKNNKYPTKNDFIKYVQQNFFEKNEIEYEKCEKENGIYIYEIKITDATGKIPEEKSFNIILKLRNGTDYEMSFGEN